MRIALAHDWLVGYRGGEAVLDAIVRALHPVTADLHLFTMFDDGRPLTPVIDEVPRTTSVLQRVPGGPEALRRWLLPMYPAAVASLGRALEREHARRPFGLLISTSSVAVKSLEPPRGVPHVCYCHSPARYLWSRGDEYGMGSFGSVRSAGLRVAGPALRAWDRATAQRVTRFLANSTHTARQIRRCYGRESTVLFPPVRTDLFTPDPRVGREGFWLVVGALEPYKRVDLAIEAARAAGKRLVVAGTGSQERELTRRAGGDAEFLGRVSDAQLVHLYRTAELLLFPQIEDFGIVAVEAQACGLGVVARLGTDPDAPGGALDTVIPEVTGAFFTEPTGRALAEAALRAGPFADATCRVNAERFGERHFELGLRSAVMDLVGS